jgi:hypothetical protein
MTQDTLRLILDKNPGLLSILLTGVLLPLGILWLTNVHNRKQKETEKSLDSKYNSKRHLRRQERKVYSSLSKILFDVQQLHASLSGSCEDADCIKNAIKKFDDSISKYHGDISNNMLYLSSQVINLIYSFYRQINDLKIEIKEINDMRSFNMASLSVFYFSEGLATTVIEIQEIFIKERIDLKIHFDKAQQETMKRFCGIKPSNELSEKYEALKRKISLKNDIKPSLT